MIQRGRPVGRPLWDRSARMTVSELNDRITRAVAAALGVVIVIALVVVARPAGGHGGVLPASLRFAASQDGAVAITPAAPQALLEDEIGRAHV